MQTTGTLIDAGLSAYLWAPALNAAANDACWRSEGPAPDDSWDEFFFP